MFTSPVNLLPSFRCIVSFTPFISNLLSSVVVMTFLAAFRASLGRSA